MTVPSVIAKGCSLDLSLNGTHFSLFANPSTIGTSYQKFAPASQAVGSPRTGLVTQYQYQGYLPAPPRSRSGSQDSHHGLRRLSRDLGQLRALGDVPQFSSNSGLSDLQHDQNLQSAALAEAYHKELVQDVLNFARFRKSPRSDEQDEESKVTTQSITSHADQSESEPSTGEESTKHPSVTPITSPSGSASESEDKEEAMNGPDQAIVIEVRKKPKKKKISSKHKRRHSHGHLRSHSAKLSVPSESMKAVRVKLQLANMNKTNVSEMKSKLTVGRAFQPHGKPIKVTLKPVRSSLKPSSYKPDSGGSLLSSSLPHASILQYTARLQSQKTGHKLHKITPDTTPYTPAMSGASPAVPHHYTNATSPRTDYTSTRSSSDPVPSFSQRTSHMASEFHRVVKVYLSERHSDNKTELGMAIPCPPPVTPVPDYMKKYEYIPSMYDIRSQRAVKVRLEALEKQAKQRMLLIQEEKAKREKVNRKEQERGLKAQQRKQIYALNKVMTQLEHGNFQAFCKTNGVECKL